ncbi:putative membrane protein [Amycolatopsis bartoniae]|uniref:DUF2231 domain-containing protein n=1 Tax=Amycolatopsis bartoniae TaxID=941986 RepID=A0A8H9J1R2_9PSEU|nr:DUF2231 domain-containing protein [Amycolatopsis bartoniae]MBB2939010.1 putative membrane protein [Amycolatopsis bartoniae]TVT04265.1 DUF2231 domain-containing protein [Amycolatopsis bartoniae]GHF65612.1 hypothetical protein GCM10017566_43970 [Amycolatopsis bartoniae]
MNLHRLLSAAERVRVLDRPAGAVARGLRTLLRNPRVDGALRGSWLGHPVHPLVVTLPIGAWTSATVFDLVLDRPDTARRLQGLGLAATPPALVFGLADYSGLDPVQRRTGALHAVGNVVASGCYLAAWRAKDRTANRVWSLAGMLAMSVSGALGGHLSYAQGAGVHRWEPVPFQRRPAVTDPAAAGWEPAAR